MYTYTIPDMSCQKCVGRISNAVQELDPNARLEFELEQKQVKIESSQSDSALREQLSEAGYAPN